VFEAQNRDAYLDKVRAAAIRDARHKAEVLAGADGAHVGKLLTIGNNLSSEEFDRARPPPPPPGTSILPGQLEVSAHVTVVFELK
jgi:hypothetical protein